MQSPEGRICLSPAPSVAASCRPFVPNCSQLTACLYRNAKIPPIGRSGASAGPVEAHDLGTWRHRERHRTVRGVDCAASVIRSEMGIELNVFAPRQGYRLLLARNADAIVVVTEADLTSERSAGVTVAAKHAKLVPGLLSFWTFAKIVNLMSFSSALSKETV